MTVSVKQLLKSKKNPPTSSSKPKQLGVLGEQRATFFLKSHGFQVIARNVRVGRDEIDIIVWDSYLQELVFVEVKTRHQVFSGDPSFAVDYRKLHALRRACRNFISQIWRKPTSYRIDVLAVWPGQIKHYRNVTW